MKRSKIKYDTYLDETEIYDIVSLSTMVENIRWYEDMYPILYAKTNNVIKTYRYETLVS